MKFFKPLMVAAFVTAFLSMSFTINTANDDVHVYTVKELKEMYGAEQIESSLNLLDTDEVVFVGNPCSGEQPCDGALAQARAQAQQLANQCCCVRFYGVICCNPQTGAIVGIDGIVTPKNCK